MRQTSGRSSGRTGAGSCRFPKSAACIIDTSGGRPDPTSPHPVQHPHPYARHYPSIPAAPPVPGEIHRATWRRRRLTAPLRTNRPSDSERVGPAQAHGSTKRLGRGFGEGQGRAGGPRRVSLAKTRSGGQAVDLSALIWGQSRLMISMLLNLLRLCPFLCGGHRQLALQNLALRQQLAAYKRTASRPKLA